MNFVSIRDAFDSHWIWLKRQRRQRHQRTWQCWNKMFNVIEPDRFTSTRSISLTILAFKLLISHMQSLTFGADVSKNYVCLPREALINDKNWIEIMQSAICDREKNATRSTRLILPRDLFALFFRCCSLQLLAYRKSLRQFSLRDENEMRKKNRRRTTTTHAKMIIKVSSE